MEQHAGSVGDWMGEADWAKWKALYQNARNPNLVLHISKDARQHARLGNVLAFIDGQTSGRFANALVPLTLAHEQVSPTTQNIAARLLTGNGINIQRN